MMKSIILPSKTDISTFESKMSYGATKSLDTGAKIINIFFDKSPFIIQTPEMNIPFGLSRWSNDNSTNDKFSIDMSFKGKETRPTLAKFYEMLKIIDRKMIKDGLENSTAWFKKKISTEAVVDALYTPIVKHSKDKDTGEITDKYPSTFRIALPYRDNNFQCSFYKDKEEIDITTIELKGAKVAAIMQCVGIWIAGGKFGCTWKAIQVKVTPNEVVSGYAFQDVNENLIESDDEDDEIEHYNKCQTSKQQNDSDNDDVKEEKEEEEEEEKEDDEEEEEVKKEEEVQPAKKIIRRKNKV